MKKKVILDVDTGIDDALGILLAVRSKQFDILGITTVNGNVSLDKATENTCKILKLLEAAERIPVIRGADRPLIRPAVFEYRVHGEDGLGGALSDMQFERTAADGFAPDFIIDSAAQHPGEITLVMTGPLTNLALAVRKDPRLVQHVKEVIFMGGVVQSFGNVTPTAEYNMYVDPEAAKIVMHAGFRSLTQVGLDVTRRALLTEEHIGLLADSPLGPYVRKSTEDYMKRYFERNGVRACAMHDPLAIGVALNRGLVTTGHYYVDVETRSDLCDGLTVCDFQNRLNRQPNVHVCLEVDAEVFFRLFIGALRT
ncbi:MULTISPECIES: nucleoside hydrolase [unclassified Paenibacillus]|uniref:nucleoside hydrolase n=1 Tax=unclassified Paenibacillus TaxID=185978 RepID=UPI001AE86CD3|nr:MULTISPECIES: nucleoside hydrolase [unclassified Paenibacillus]MBP1154156.1 purine nucleosidase [Paenibacillus sp. PvP091]MBP1170459.1 purine nucleosidase [Paenibacillus sp. PvR098]MBP2441487.1 purine nucleosidase [Paenibacillus sp. PvP052]